MTDASSRFDDAYYRRYYLAPDTRVSMRVQTARLARFVFAYLRYLEQPVQRVLDAGCGLGWWRTQLRRHHPRAHYHGIEISAYLCERFGWERASIAVFDADTPFDLVICQGVMQYLGDDDARSAIAGVERLCRGALYLEALTKEDWDGNVDRARTDSDVYLRPASWYRRQLAAGFVNVGGGLFLSRRSAVVLFELEKAEPPAALAQGSAARVERPVRSSGGPAS